MTEIDMEYDPQQEAEEELIRQLEYQEYAKASVLSDVTEKELEIIQRSDDA